MLPQGSVVLGNYRPMDSYLHRLDARAKMLPVGLILILAMLSQSYLFHLLLLAGLGGSLVSSGIGMSMIFKNFRPILYLVGLTSVYHLIFSGAESQIIFEFMGFSLREGAVHNALFFSVRLLLFVSTAFLITLTSSPSDLAESISRLLKPLARLRVPVNDLSLILFIALRFIPILTDEFVAIRNAQIMRGVDFSGGYITRLKRTGSLLLPVFIAAIERADDLALAIEARGYRSDIERTSYSDSKIGNSELMFMIMVSTAIIISFFLTGEVWLREI